MARYIGPRCRRARRVGSDLSLSAGLRPLDSKCKLAHPPGAHGSKKSRITDYGRNLIEKQRIRWSYGVSEKAMAHYYSKASRQKIKDKSKGYHLLRLLECRLDNIVYRMGFAATRAEARQLVSHKAIWVNGKTVNIPSCQIQPGDSVGIRDKAKSQLRIQAALELAKQRVEPSWIEVDFTQLQGTLKLYPERKELPADFQESQVIEYYSK